MYNILMDLNNAIFKKNTIMTPEFFMLNTLRQIKINYLQQITIFIKLKKTI